MNGSLGDNSHKHKILIFKRDFKRDSFFRNFKNKFIINFKMQGIKIIPFLHRVRRSRNTHQCSGNFHRYTQCKAYLNTTCPLTRCFRNRLHSIEYFKDIDNIFQIYHTIHLCKHIIHLSRLNWNRMLQALCWKLVSSIPHQTLYSTGMWSISPLYSDNLVCKRTLYHSIQNLYHKWFP